MLPETFEQSNINMQKPTSWKDEECTSLPVCFCFQELSPGHNVPCFISKWKPNKEELEALNRGEGIYLTIFSSSLPPSGLQVESPFEDEECIIHLPNIPKV